MSVLTQKTVIRQGRWLKCFKPKPAARLKLVCLPFAGGGANCYRRWENFFSWDVELNAVLLPGRESRLAEPRVGSADKVCNAVIEELIETWWKKPLVLFGHSMGSVLALEVAWRLKEKYDWEPKVLFASGRRPPHLHFGGDYHKAPEEVFIRELKRLNGTPDSLFQDEEMRRIMLPMLRDDYAILETYRIPRSLQLSCPIITCTGDLDPDATPAEMTAWVELTKAPCEHKVFSGDHFYINNSASELTGLINGYLSSLF